MKIKDLVGKLLKGEKLNAEEEKTIQGIDPDGVAALLDAEKNRAAQLQKDLDAEKAKTKEAEDKIKAAEAEKLKALPEVDQLKAQLVEKDNQIAGLNTQLASVAGERDTAKQEHSVLVRKNRIAELAAKTGFESPEYLDYLANVAQVDIAKDDKVTPWISQLKKDSPKFFRAEVKPGAGSGQPPAGGGGAPKVEAGAGGGRKIDVILESLNNAPVIP